MKTPALLATALLALATFAYGVPTQINYQGVLTDQAGNPVNGVRAMQIKIYDAPTGGTLLYSEDLGNVPVQDGIYSFSFGANGTSNALTTETVAIANGTVSTFQKVLAAPTVVAGSVTVTDGTYTWDQTNGSSNENDFSVAYSPNLRRVTVTYYSAAPVLGKNITATYRTPNFGITGALSGSNNLWVEVLINGISLNSRQKLLTVPFALFSLNSSQSVDEEVRKRMSILERSVAQTAGLVFSNATTNGTDSLNSSGNYLGILNKMNDLNGVDWFSSGTLTANNKRALGVVLNFYFYLPGGPFDQAGTIKFIYSDSSNSTVNWSVTKDNGPVFVINPFPNKNLNYIQHNSSVSLKPSIVGNEIAKITFDVGNLYANEIYASPSVYRPENAESFSDKTIIINISGKPSVIGKWNEWITLPSGSWVNSITIAGKPTTIRESSFSLRILTHK